MKFENCTIRVNKNNTATEVFITNTSGLNTAIYLPPDAKVEPNESLEFVPVPAEKAKPEIPSK